MGLSLGIGSVYIVIAITIISTSNAHGQQDCKISATEYGNHSVA